MNIITTKIEGLLIIEPHVWKDERGYFFETYQAYRYREMGIENHFIQDNEAFSVKGALRGLHYQVPPFAQSKLVRVISGEVLDIAVDIRPQSPTFGQHESILLSGDNKKQFFVPAGFAHGYLTLSDTACFVYKCDGYYAQAAEGGIKYDDPDLAIDWLLPSDELTISVKDMTLPFLSSHRKFEEV